LNYARIIELKGLQLAKVNFYTVWIEGDDNSEFTDFINRMKLTEKNKTELAELVKFIVEIGDKYGAKDKDFHFEASAHALSLRHIEINSDANDFGLRLYCLKLSESVVILFNGDRKTTQKAQDCPNCAKYFRLAQRIATTIDTAIREKDIIPVWKRLIFDDDFDIII
jgi:hypothetical protein